MDVPVARFAQLAANVDAPSLLGQLPVPFLGGRWATYAGLYLSAAFHKQSWRLVGQTVWGMSGKGLCHFTVSRLLQQIFPESSISLENQTASGYVLINSPTSLPPVIA